ncbi:MAG: hypothetical protein JNK72_00185 [Myxococcales bacterium]|nr:hypothetical protein [Myxococcales bacterium]
MPLVDPAAILARLLRARPELAADVRAAAHALADEAVDGLSTPPLRRRAPIRHPDPAPAPLDELAVARAEAALRRRGVG